jgi:putative phosphoesterase
VVTARSSKAQPVQKLERLQVRDDGSFRLAVVSDTHSAPHPRALSLLAAQHPDALLHAGDIGELRVLDELAKVCPVLAVRGNVDVRLPGLPDVLVIEVEANEQVLLRLLMTHVGVYGPKLRADVVRLAQAEKASVVVCGHSHVPFIGRDRGLMVFNPGSAGPRRFGLPIVFGTIDVSATAVRLCHIDCETGHPWQPPDC